MPCHTNLSDKSVCSTSCALANTACTTHYITACTCLQVHLGFFLSEQLAAKAYDRAAITKSLHEGQKVATNFDLSTYRDEMKVLTAMNQDDFVAALADEE